MNFVLATTFLALGSAIPMVHSRSMLQQSLEAQFLSSNRPNDDRRFAARRTELSITQQCIDEMEEINNDETYGSMMSNFILNCPKALQPLETTENTAVMDMDYGQCDNSAVVAYCDAKGFGFFEPRNFTLACEADTNPQGKAVATTVTFRTHYMFECLPQSCPTDHADWTDEDMLFLLNEDSRGDCIYTPSVEEFMPSAASTPVMPRTIAQWSSVAIGAVAAPAMLFWMA